MFRKSTSFATFALMLSCSLTFAQKPMDTKMSDTKQAMAAAPAYSLFSPNDQWEFGIHGGLALLVGDLKTDFSSPAVGIHLRKALDNVFSLRADVDLQIVNSKPILPAGQQYLGPETRNNFGVGDVRTFTDATSTIFQGTLQVVAALANGRWDAGVRKISPYVFGGVGFGNLGTQVNVTGTTDGSKTTLGKQDLVLPGDRNTGSVAPLAEGGVGVAFRVNDKFNIALEEKASTFFGKRADLIDGFQYGNRDFILFTNVRLNFNIGGGAAADKTLPLWWVGPAEQLNSRVAALEARPKFDPTDTDGDGVIDMFDQEPNTPAGARVDMHGVALDSDGDGIPDYKDKEPFSPPGYKVDANGVAIVPKPAYITEPDVDRIVDAKLAKLKSSWEPATNKGASLADWFLPMIHFDFNSAKIKESELGNLSAVASVLKNNSTIRILANGFTDRVSSDSYNQGLSYRRAQAAIDMLVKRFGVDRSRLVLAYEGENKNLVPTNSANYMNRRVEFSVAKANAEVDMNPPVMEHKSHKGNKNAGY